MGLGVLTDARGAGGAVVDASVSRNGGAPSSGHDDGDVVVAGAGLAAELRGAGLEAVAALADGLGAGAGVAERGSDVGERVVGVGDKFYCWTWGLEVGRGHAGADGAGVGLLVWAPSDVGFCTCNLLSRAAGRVVVCIKTACGGS